MPLLKIPASLLGAVHALLPKGGDFALAAIAVMVALGAAVLASRLLGRRVLAERAVPGTLAALTAVMGLLDVASAATPAPPGSIAALEAISPLELRHASHLAAGFAGLALIYLARGLARRKRSAWVIAVVALTVSVAAHLSKGLDWEEAVLAAALAGAFMVARRSFHALSDAPSLRQGLGTLVGGTLITVGFGVAAFRALAARHERFLSIEDALRATFNVVLSGDAAPVTLSGPFDRLLPLSLSVAAAAVAAVSLVMVLRPVVLRAPASGADRLRASGIAARWGRNVLDRYALFDDKHYRFSPQGSVTAYVAVGRRAVALHGPIGPAEDRREAAADFLAHCLRSDWEPSVYQAGTEDLADLAAAGFGASLRIGHEAILDLSAFSLAGKRSQDLRTALNRAAKEGGRLAVSEPPHPSGFIASLRATNEEWLTVRGGFEQRFALGRFDEEYLAGCPLVVAVDAAGRAVGFLSLVGEFGSGRVAVDLMRSGIGAPRGTMDALFATALGWAKEKGYAGFNFGLASFAQVGEHPDDPPLEKAIAASIPVLERFYGFGGLAGFKEKFDPVWEPRFLVVRSSASLVPTLYAVARIHLGFDPLPFALAKVLGLPKSK